MTGLIITVSTKNKSLITYEKFKLQNGLRVVVHEDPNTPMVAVNLLYNVGARDESPDKTGFAHLFEHLMFGGSANVPNFDEPIQMAGGENNAFTNNDITNFYNILPASNVETAFWLESDRMLNLCFDENSLEVQRKVVIEEFKETCLNQPYGDVWHHLTDMAYKVHPYRWPTIGKIPQHVEKATMEDVKDFFFKYYAPNNAILSVAGNITFEQVQQLAHKWFGQIPARAYVPKKFPKEPPQARLEQRTQYAKVPIDCLYLAFHIAGRKDADYYVTDLLSDILCNGGSSRLYRRLLKERRLFNQIDCYITGSIDPGLLIIEGKPAEGVSLEQAEQAIWQELELLKTRPIEEGELLKYQNKIETNLVFSEMNILNRAINLAFFEALGDIELINEETRLYRAVTTRDIQRLARHIFVKENCSELYYRKEEENTISA